MASQAEVVNLQVIRLGISGQDGSNTQIITTGLAKVNFEATNTGEGALKQETFVALLEPAFQPGQFRRAIATGSLAQVSFGAAQPPATSIFSEWGIKSVEADLEDETGKVELRLELFASTLGFGSILITSIAFQVITLAAL